MRPYILTGSFNLPKLFCRLDDEIRKSIFEGYFTYQTGMAMGADIWAAEIVLKLKKEFPDVRLVCCLPCETQADTWPNSLRETYFDTLAAADEVICQQENYTIGCIQRRNRRMIDVSSRLIAIHDEKPSGGAARTIGYARKRGLDVVTISPL